METKNWIEKIKETIRVAMNKGLRIEEQTYSNFDLKYCFEINDGDIQFNIYNDHISIFTSKGIAEISYKCTDKEDFELKGIALSIKDYRENMAISELEEFICDKDESSKVVTIDDLDNEDD